MREILWRTTSSLIPEACHCQKSTFEEFGYVEQRLLWRHYRQNERKTPPNTWETHLAGTIMSNVK